MSPIEGKGSSIPDNESWNLPAPHAAKAAIPKVIPINLEVDIIPEAAPVIDSFVEFNAARVMGAINRPNPNPAVTRGIVIHGSVIVWFHPLIINRERLHRIKPKIEGILKS